MSAPISPLYLASQAQNLARHSAPGEALAFNRIALVSMGIMAVSAATTTLGTLLRELNRKHDQERARSR